MAAASGSLKRLTSASVVAEGRDLDHLPQDTGGAGASIWSLSGAQVTVADAHGQSATGSC